MKNIKLKKIFRWIFLILWNVCAFLGLLFIGFVLFYLFDDASRCISEYHGVWDGHQNICRYDCLKWTEETGCIPLSTNKTNEKILK